MKVTVLSIGRFSVTICKEDLLISEKYKTNTEQL